MSTPVGANNSDGACGVALGPDKAFVTVARFQSWPLVFGVALGAAGLVAAFPWQIRALWQLWITDPLRSIGILILPVSAILAARAWRGFRWGAGTWWGLGLTAAAVGTAQIGRLGPFAWMWPSVGVVDFTPVAFLIFGYVSGIVLLLGGSDAWRRARFPLLLLLGLNPVPRFFSNLVDLPLQAAGARVARDFASVLGLHLGGAQLRLMFSPALGMFVAPGCNGLQGAVAMGYLALVIGYLRHLRLAAHTLFATAGVALAYLFNLLRLCTLVLAYRVALALPALAAHMAAVDYVVGGFLFAIAAWFLLILPGKLGGRQ